MYWYFTPQAALPPADTMRKRCHEREQTLFRSTGFKITTSCNKYLTCFPFQHWEGRAGT